MNKIAIIIPCYNEEKTIGKVLGDCQKYIPDAELYVVDNNSSDKTAEVARSYNAHIIHENRQGKAYAVKTAFQKIEADIYVMIDGDDTYPLSQIQNMIEPIKAGSADMTVGDRHSSGDYGRENKRRFHGIGNNSVKWTINLLFKSKLKDILSGYRAFSRRFVKNYPLICDGFELEADLTIHALHYDYKIEEVQISFQDRPEGSESKLNTIRDGVKILFLIFELFKDNRPMLFFSILTLIALVLSLFTGSIVIHQYIDTHFIRSVPLAILSASSFLLGILFFISGLILDILIKQDKKQMALRLLK